MEKLRSLLVRDIKGSNGSLMTDGCMFSLMSSIFWKCQVTSYFRALGERILILTPARKWCIVRISVRAPGCTGPFLALRARKSVVHAARPCSWCRCQLTKVGIYLDT